jgi:hypothetical protein
MKHRNQVNTYIYSGGEHMSKMSMLSPSKSLDIATSKKLQEKPLEVP